MANYPLAQSDDAAFLSEKKAAYRVGKSRSLLEQLPEIVRAGKRQAERILEGLEARTRVALQTRELVTPAKDTNWQEFQSLKPHAKAQTTVGGELALREGSGQQQLVAGGASQWFNRLIYGDNLLAMAALLAGDAETPSLRGKIDLIYNDPPFDSKADYRTKITLPGGDVEQKPTVIEQFAYSDTWVDGTASYLAMIVPRLCLMRELLSEQGSIYVHLDRNVGHYVKATLDEVFGRENFRNEIIWIKNSLGAKGRATQYPRNYESIFFYSKSASYHFEKQFKEEISYIEISNGHEKLPAGVKVDDQDRYYWTSPKGDYTEESILKLEKEGRVERTRSGNVRIKFFLERRGNKLIKQAILNDTWDDIDLVFRSSDPQTGYGTQKPEGLLERIFRASCPNGGLVADFFGGSGTTAAVAEKLGRRWITSDLGKPACMIMRKRLIDQNARPFFYQAIGDYQVEAARSTLGKKFRVGDLAQIVLGLYGALPLQPEDNPNRNLGYLSRSSRGNEAQTSSPEKDQSLLTSAATNKKILVFVDSPQKLTGLATLKKAQALRASHLGGWEKVVVLGWNFTADIGEVITNLNDTKLEVLVIPPDLLDRLKKSGGYEKLKVDFDAQRIRFSSLQYVTVKPMERKAIASGEVLTVELENYVLLSPDALNLEAKDKERLQAVVNRDPLALVEYWSVDPDYDGEVFRSVWQDYRGNTDNDDDPLHVVRKAVLSGLPVKSGSRRVCVRVVDVFGFESEVVKTV
jgi:adenine-specific DNA-methyltransferase